MVHIPDRRSKDIVEWLVPALLGLIGVLLGLGILNGLNALNDNTKQMQGLREDFAGFKSAFKEQMIVMQQRQTLMESRQDRLEGYIASTPTFKAMKRKNDIEEVGRKKDN